MSLVLCVVLLQPVRCALVVFEESLHASAERQLEDCALEPNTTDLVRCDVVLYYGSRVRPRRELLESDFTRPHLARCEWREDARPQCHTNKPWIRDARLECTEGARRASECHVSFDPHDAVVEILLCVLFVCLVVAAVSILEIVRWYRDDQELALEDEQQLGERPWLESLDSWQKDE